MWTTPRILKEPTREAAAGAREGSERAPSAARGHPVRREDTQGGERTLRAGERAPVGCICSSLRWSAVPLSQPDAARTAADRRWTSRQSGVRQTYGLFCTCNRGISRAEGIGAERSERTKAAATEGGRGLPLMQQAGTGTHHSARLLQLCQGDKLGGSAGRRRGHVGGRVSFTVAEQRSAHRASRMWANDGHEGEAGDVLQRLNAASTQYRLSWTEHQMHGGPVR